MVAGRSARPTGGQVGIEGRRVLRVRRYETRQVAGPPQAQASRPGNLSTGEGERGGKEAGVGDKRSLPEVAVGYRVRFRGETQPALDRANLGAG
jgi:hypothetical protein